MGRELFQDIGGKIRAICGEHAITQSQTVLIFT